MKEITTYLDWLSGHTTRAPSMYGRHLKRFREFTRKDLRQATLNDVVRFVDIQKTKYAPANVAYAVVILKNFYMFWRVQGKKCLDPFLLKPPKFVTKSHSPVTPEEFQKMQSVLDEFKFNELRLKVVIQLLWYTGVRVSELCDLNLSDIDSKIPRACIVTKKNNKKRWIFWPKETHDLLLRYIGVRLCLNQKPALFISSQERRRERITTRSVQRWIKELCDRCEIERKLSPHSFRHAKAHRILDLGGNVKDVQAILGHSENNPIASFSYLRLNPTEIEKRARRLF